MMTEPTEDEQKLSMFTTTLLGASQEISELLGVDREFMINGLLHSLALTLAFGSSKEGAESIAQAFADKLKELVPKYHDIVKERMYHDGQELEHYASVAERAP